MQENQQPITKQITALYEKVQQQVQQYCSLMEKLQHLAEQIEQKLLSLESEQKAAQEHYQQQLQDFQSTVNAALQEIQEKSSRILPLYESLSDMHALKTEYSEALQKLQEEIQKISGLRTTINQYVSNQIEKQLIALERKFRQDFSTLEDSITAVENRFLSIYDRQKREIEMLENTIADLKEKIPEIKSLSDEIQFVINDAIQRVQQEIELQIAQISESLNSEQLKPQSREYHLERTEEEIEEKITQFEQRFQTLQEKYSRIIDQLESQRKLIIYLIAAASLVFVLLLFLFLTQ